jgi:chromosome segregation ATPase
LLVAYIHRRPGRALLLPLALLVLAAARPAFAVDLSKRVEAYAKQHNLPIREVTVDLPGRKVKRIFIPVTDASANDFVTQITQEGVVVRQAQNDVEHVHMAFGPNETVWHGRVAVGPDQNAMLKASNGGLYVGIGLEPDAKAYLKQNIAVNGAAANKTGRSSGCMWWLANATVGQDKPLAHAAGVKQSTAPSNFVRKLVHAGTEVVVVGVAMSDIAAQPALLQIHQQITNYENAINNAKAQIETLEAAKQDPNALRDQQTAGNRNAIAQAQAQIANYEKIRLDPNAHREQQTAPQRAQIDRLKAQIANLEQAKQDVNALRVQQTQGYRNQIANLERNIAQYQANPAYANHVVQWRAQIVQQQAAIDNWKSPYHQQLANLDVQILQQTNNIKGWQANPGYAPHVQNAKTAIANFERQKAELTAAGEAGYNPNWPQIEAVRAQIVQQQTIIDNWKSPYHQQLANLDAQIAQQENNIKVWQPNPAYANHIKNARTAVDGLQKQRAELTSGGEAGYNPNWAQIQQLQAQIAQHQAVIDNWKSPYHQQLANLDAQIANLEQTIKTHGALPQYQNQAPQWQQQLVGFRQQREAMIAKGEAGYNPYEPQIQQQRAYIAQQQPMLDQLKAQLAQAEVLNKPGDIAQRFNALTEAQLMGAPPGGGAVGAVKQ